MAAFLFETEKCEVVTVMETLIGDQGTHAYTDRRTGKDAQGLRCRV